jgi:hypothetical protein
MARGGTNIGLSVRRYFLMIAGVVFGVVFLVSISDYFVELAELFRSFTGSTVVSRRPAALQARRGGAPNQRASPDSGDLGGRGTLPAGSGGDTSTYDAIFPPLDGPQTAGKDAPLAAVRRRRLGAHAREQASAAKRAAAVEIKARASLAPNQSPTLREEVAPVAGTVVTAPLT